MNAYDLPKGIPYFYQQPISENETDTVCIIANKMVIYRFHKLLNRIVVAHCKIDDHKNWDITLINIGQLFPRLIFRKQL